MVGLETQLRNMIAHWLRIPRTVGYVTDVHLVNKTKSATTKK